MNAPNSKAPLWLTLGFAVGVVFGWMVFEHNSTAASATSPVLQAGLDKPTLPLIPDSLHDGARLGEVEELFMAWGGYSIWKGDRTQFAAWNREAGRHADFYEVRRSGRKFYFRTLPTADWPLIDHGQIVRCPVWFAEPPEMREAYYREHPSARPGQPVPQSRPKRSPLLPPLPPESAETSPVAPPQPEPMLLTPGAGG